MQKRAPTLGNIFVIILFALSCFGLLLFLWESFGGPLPLKPKGYRFSVSFPRTLVLSEQSDVRISGVDVGHVVGLKLNKSGTTDAEIDQWLVEHLKLGGLQRLTQVEFQQAALLHLRVHLGLKQAIDALAVQLRPR